MRDVSFHPYLSHWHLAFSGEPRSSGGAIIGGVLGGLLGNTSAILDQKCSHWSSSSTADVYGWMILP